MTFEVKIWKNYNTFATHIVILDRTHKENRVINLYTGESYLLKEYEQIPDNYIMKINDIMVFSIFKALGEALDNEGIKTDNDFKIQGLLEATKFHLNDMRKLVFKQKGE